MDINDCVPDMDMERQGMSHYQALHIALSHCGEGSAGMEGGFHADWRGWFIPAQEHWGK